jgi:hypothetical protein
MCSEQSLHSLQGCAADLSQPEQRQQLLTEVRVGVGPLLHSGLNLMQLLYDIIARPCLKQHASC